MEMRFRDRTEAGRFLAESLSKYAKRPDVVVLGLPRGGVPVAFEVARALNAPLDVFVVRKLGAPWQPELAMGAIATGGVRVLNNDVVRGLGITNEEIESVAAEEQKELERRERVYRGGRPAPDVSGRTVILVDDGVATGTTMRAAIAALRKLGPARIIVGVGVSASQTYDELRTEVDEVLSASTPEFLFAISEGYERFPQTTDEEVRTLMERASAARAGAAPK